MNPETQAIIDKLLGVVAYPSNGHHYCRWCNGGTHTDWKHDFGCGYVAKCKAFDEGRAAAEAAAAKEGGK